MLPRAPVLLPWPMGMIKPTTCPSQPLQGVHLQMAKPNDRQLLQPSWQAVFGNKWDLIKSHLQLCAVTQNT